MINAAAARASRPFSTCGGKQVCGPDVDASVSCWLAGPLGLEGRARLTPFPVTVADTHTGLTLHDGPIGLTGGWRWVDLRGDGTDAPALMFRGPQWG